MFINKERFFLIISGILVLNSCIKKGDFKAYDAPDTWEGAFASPLVDSKVTLGQVFKDTLVIQRDKTDNSYYFTISDSLESPTAESLINLKGDTIDAKVQFNVSNPQPFLIPGTNIKPILDAAGGSKQEISFDVAFADSIQFDYILLKKGSFNLDVNTSLKHKVYYTLTCTSLLDNLGNAFVYRDSLIPNKVTPSKKVVIDGFKISLKDQNQPSTKFFASIQIDSAISTASEIKAVESINFKFAISEVKFKRILGQFKSLNFTNNGSFGQSFDLSAFDNPLFKNIKLADPRINLKFVNSYGVNLNLDLSGIKSVSADGTKSNLTFTPSNKSILTLNAPSASSFEFGQSKTTDFEINKDVSNLPDFLFNPTPAKLDITPGGSLGLTFGTQFIEDDSKIKINFSVKLPVYGQISDLEIKDTVDYIFPENLSLDAVTFKTLVTNELPINVKVQLYLMDKNYQRFDSIYVIKSGDNGNIFEAATGINSVGRATIPSQPKLIQIDRDKDWYDRVYGKTEHIQVVAKVFTPNTSENSGNVKFFSDQGVRIQLALKVAGKLVMK